MKAIFSDEAIKRPLVIAGPCAAESEAQVMEAARQLKAIGVGIMRAGVWKPRTMPGCFEGIGSEALVWMARAKRETGMLMATEVCTPEHVEQALAAGIDLLWIGARTTANPFAVQAIADKLRGTDVPVMVKNPVNPDANLWTGAIERLERAGLERLGAVHRGFSTYGECHYRNAPVWAVAIELRRRMPQLPLLCDPSHMGGQRRLVAPLCQQALDMDYDGLMIECHPTPDLALSDAAQQITPAELARTLKALVVRQRGESAAELDLLRRQIDDIDVSIVSLAARRMAICRDIGRYKQAHNMTILQSARYDAMLRDRQQWAEADGLSAQFAARLFERIHEEAVRQQMEIGN